MLSARSRTMNSFGPRIQPSGKHLEQEGNVHATLLCTVNENDIAVTKTADTNEGLMRIKITSLSSRNNKKLSEKFLGVISTTYPISCAPPVHDDYAKLPIMGD